jgi:hypothetical protein
MQPLDFLTTAENLVLSEREADWRTCISRSYYALYLLIIEEMRKTISPALLGSISFYRNGMFLHAELSRFLKASSDVQIRRFGEHLDNLRSARIAADYYMHKPVSRQKAAGEFENAINLRDELHRYGVPNLAKTVRSDLQKVQGRAP